MSKHMKAQPHVGDMGQITDALRAYFGDDPTQEEVQRKTDLLLARKVDDNE